MHSSEKLDGLMLALLEAKRAMAPVYKGKKNDHFKYAYANEEAWYDAVQPSLLANSLILTFSIEDYSRTGTLTMVRGSARVTHAPSCQFIEIYGIGEGEDKNDKAAYKAMTGLKKYLYALAFSLPTTDDVEDPIHDRQRAAAEVATKARATAPAATQAQVNAKLVEEGHPPQHNAEDKERARALFLEAKLVDYSDANRIKRNCGTDYAKMAEELKLFIDAAKKLGNK